MCNSSNCNHPAPAKPTRLCGFCRRPLNSKRAMFHKECKNFQSFFNAAVSRIESMQWAPEAAYVDGDSKRMIAGPCLKRVRSLWTRSCNMITKGHVLTENDKRTKRKVSDLPRCPQCGKRHSNDGKHCADCVEWIAQCKARKVCTVCNCQLEKPKRGPMPTACKECRDLLNYLTGAVKIAQEIKYAGGVVELTREKGEKTNKGTASAKKVNVRNEVARRHTATLWGVLNYDLKPHVVAQRCRRPHSSQDQ